MQPRLITAGEDRWDVRAIDIGMVSVRDAAIYAQTRPLIAYADGRCIKSVRFIPSNAQIPNNNIYFVTPNTALNSGMAWNEGAFDLAHASDTSGLLTDSRQTSLGGLTGSPNEVGWTQIIDASPLIALSAGGPEPVDILPLGTWTPSTRYCIGDQILDSNDNIQFVSVNGVSGSSEPTWGTEPDDTVNDGTVEWTCLFPCPSGELHAIAEVIEGISPMPPYLASIEFVNAPTDVVAGEIMSEVTVLAKDQHGQPYVFQAQAVSLSIFGEGTLGGTPNATINQTTGVATFNDLTITEPAEGYVIRARTSPFMVAPIIYSPPFNVTAP